MKHAPHFAFGFSAFALFAAISAVAAPAPAGRPALQDAATEDTGRAVFAQTCIKCHDSERILQTRRTKAEWQDIIGKMIERGATGSGQDFETVFDYVQRHYGKVYINDAGANEIARILGLSSTEASAIVAFRTANGAFADVDALKKVPGLDAKKLDGREEALAF